MLTLYLLFLGSGGVLLLLSLLGGGDGADDDMDVDADVDVDVDVDVEVEAEHDALAGSAFAEALAVLPIASLRFWTFFLAFSGLTGAALTLLHAVGPVLTAGLATLAGWLAGLSVTTFTRWLGRTEVSSTLERRDFVGASGTVLLPMSRGVRGRIRVALENQVVDVDAETDDEPGLAGTESVVVYAVRDDGVVLVTSRGEKT